ncbi:MAG: P1 family peptidase, partial [Candidatus Aminicenantes bacterium]
MNESKKLQLIGNIPWVHPHGKKNAIVDVGDIRVGHLTVSRDTQNPSGLTEMVRTGLTAVIPGDMNEENRFFFGCFSFRNIHEITGYAVIEDFCYLNSPIVLTNSYNLGIAYDAVLSFGFQLGRTEIWPPVALSIDDSYLNGQKESAVEDKDVIQLLQNASNHSVKEGSVGVGLGLRAFGWKGGIGTSSRLFSINGELFSVGALVASNHGTSELSDGTDLNHDEHQRNGNKGSLTMVLATDMPLLPHQINKVSTSIVVALPSASTVKNSMDSITGVLFSLANAMSLKDDGPKVFDYTAVDDSLLSTIIRAGLESVVEAVLRSLCLSESVVG